MSNWIIFLHHTPKFGIPVEMVQFLLKLLLKQISCCAPRFQLILTAKFHSLYVHESYILRPTPQPCCRPHILHINRIHVRQVLKTFLNFSLQCLDEYIMYQQLQKN